MSAERTLGDAGSKLVVIKSTLVVPEGTCRGCSKEQDGWLQDSKCMSIWTDGDSYKITSTYKVIKNINLPRLYISRF